MKQILLALISAVFVMTSCTLLESKDDTASLAVTLPDSGAARAIQADGTFKAEDAKSYRVTIASGASSESRTTDSGKSVFFLDIPAGVWNVSVEAFSEEGCEGVLVARGAAAADVSDGVSASVSVSLVKVDHTDMIVYDLDMYDRIMASDSKTFRVATTRQFQQLQALSKDSAKNFSGATVSLLADVESSSDKYLKDFAGTFDGGKHTVTLNGYALVAGKLSGTVKNVIVEGLVDSSVESYIGGIAEKTNNATISCCINRATIQYGAGGIVGMLYGGNTVIERCGNEGTFVPALVNGKGASGGILGSDISTPTGTTATIRNCYNTGAVEKNYNEYSGGIVGYGCYSKITIEKCYDKNSTSTYNYDIIGSVTASPSETKGVTMTDCYSAQQKGTDSKCGTKVTDFSDPSQFPGFDFVNVWEIKNGRPVLRDIQ